MDKRNDFKRLIRDCKKGKIDRIITKTVSRFARNTIELLTVTRALKEMGVSIYFEEQGVDTATLDLELVMTFPGIAAQRESETISENMRWSYQKRMESGEFNCCRAAYGYDLIDGELQINEAEAEVIRRIFHLYLQGCGKQAIANQLNADGVPKRYGQKTWHLFTIDYILNNERYMGDALLQKSYTTECLPFTKKRNRGEKTQSYVENSNPAIVSRETYQAAQELQKRKSNSNQCTPKNRYPFNGVLKCPVCGHNYRRQIVNGTAYWLCSYKAASRTECVCERIREDAVMSAFMRMSDKLTQNREELLKNRIFEYTSLLYENLDTTERMTEMIRATLQKTRSLSCYNGELTAEIAAAFTLHADKTVSLTLKNGQQIRKERTDGSNITETSAHHHPDHTAGECAQYTEHYQAGGRLLPRIHQAG